MYLYPDAHYEMLALSVSMVSLNDVPTRVDIRKLKRSPFFSLANLPNRSFPIAIAAMCGSMDCIFVSRDPHIKRRTTSTIKQSTESQKCRLECREAGESRVLISTMCLYRLHSLVDRSNRLVFHDDIDVDKSESRRKIPSRFFQTQS